MLVYYVGSSFLELLALIQGAPGVRAPPSGSKFFHFHTVFGTPILGVGAPSSKILDPPLT